MWRASVDSLIDDTWCASGLGKGLPAYCASRGIDVYPFAQSVGLDASAFDIGRDRISLERFGILFDLLAEASGDVTFGLGFGESYVLGDSGPIGFALMNAPSLGAMWRFFLEMHELSVGLTSYRLEEAGPHVVNLHAFSPLTQHIDTLQDALLTIFIRHLRVHAGEGWCPQHMDLQRSEPINRAPWERIFCPNLTFGQLVGRSYVTHADLDRTNPSADPRIFEIMTTLLRGALDQFRAERDIAQRLRHAVQCNLVFGKTDLTTMSRAMGMSERSLQRRLAERGLSYEALVKSVQRDLVRILLSQPSMRMADVAERCGYSSAASFSRAVSGWYGLPPSALRRQILTKQPAI